MRGYGFGLSASVSGRLHLLFSSTVALLLTRELAYDHFADDPRPSPRYAAPKTTTPTLATTTLPALFAFFDHGDLQTSRSHPQHAGPS